MKCSPQWLIPIMLYESCSLVVLAKASITIDHTFSQEFEQTSKK